MIALHAAHLLDVKTGHIVSPGEIVVQGERIIEVGSAVKRPAGAEVIDLGDRTPPARADRCARPSFSASWGGGPANRTGIGAAAHDRGNTGGTDDLMAGFTAERDMGTEGAGSADTAVRNAIEQRHDSRAAFAHQRECGEHSGRTRGRDRLNPAQRVLPNADYANTADELVAVMRQQFKEGANFTKIYETGPDSIRDGKHFTVYQYSEAQLEAAVKEAARLGKKVAVHATGEPGTLFAAQAGVVSIDHATSSAMRRSG